MASDWAEERGQGVAMEWKLLHFDNTGPTDHNWKVLWQLIAAALDEAREGLEQEQE